MHSRTLAVALVVLAFAGTGASAQESSHAEDISRLDSLAGAFVANGHTPGLSVFVLSGNDTLLLRSYGHANLEDSVATKPRTVFRIGSVTKPFTATAVIQLVQEGRITLDDSIQQFLPTFPTQGHRVTIRHLLTHTSGIRSYTSVKGYDPNLDAPPDSVIALIARQPFDFPPGERFLYNNSGYYLLGIILERVTGHPYHRVVQNRFTAPLGLPDTRYCFLRPVIPRRAAGYTVDGGPFINARYNAMSQPFAAGGLCSTVLDLVTWARTLFSGQMIRPDLLEAMTTPARLKDGSTTGYGFGLSIDAFDGHRRISHGGGINGFTSSLAYYPDDDLTIVVLANANTDLSRLVVPITRVALGLPLGGR